MHSGAVALLNKKRSVMPLSIKKVPYMQDALLRRGFYGASSWCYCSNYSYFYFYIAPLVITVFNIINLVKKKPALENRTDIFTFLLGIPLSLFLFASWGAKDYKEAIVLDPTSFRLHTPISYEHILTFIVFAFIATAGYLILRKKRVNYPQL